MSKTAVIDSVRSKVDRLMEDNRRLRGEYDALTAQRDKLKADNRSLAQQIVQLEKRIGILELKGGLAGTAADNKLARARINRLMREVDKCIALLNR